MAHIGIDATCWLNRRGYGRHARALFGELVRIDPANHYTMVVDSPEATPILPAGAEIRLVATGRAAVEAASADGRRSIADAWRMSRAMADPNFDVVIFPTVYTFLPVFSRARKIVFIHDVIPETFPELTTPRPMARLWWRSKVLCAIGQADLVVTVSAYSRDGIRRCFGVDPEAIKVVGEAADPVFRRLTDPRPTLALRKLGFNATAPNIVYVGGFGPHKNLSVLLEVFARLAPGAVLWMVGDWEGDAFHSEIGGLRSIVADRGVSNRVIFTGYLPDEDLVVLLNLATVLVLPSLMEGFGLPAIEAALCGCPVIATAASPVAEILGKGAISIDPASPRALEEALNRVIASESLRASMSLSGLEAACRLSWSEAARVMLRQIQDLLP